MKRITVLLAALGLLAATAGAARADDAATQQPGAATEAQTQTPSTQPAPAAGVKKADPKVEQKASAALDATAKDVDKAASADGDQKVAERLAADFGTTPDALLAEKNDLKASWGSIMIAHSIMANASADITAKQLFDQRDGGKSWGQIADDLGFRLGELVKAAKEESRVAKGTSKPDGKVAVVHGAGSKFGMSAAPPSKTANAGANGAAQAEAPKSDAAKAETAKAEEAKPEAAPAPSAPATGTENSTTK